MCISVKPWIVSDVGRCRPVRVQVCKWGVPRDETAATSNTQHPRLFNSSLSIGALCRFVRHSTAAASRKLAAAHLAPRAASLSSGCQITQRTCRCFRRNERGRTNWHQHLERDHVLDLARHTRAVLCRKVREVCSCWRRRRCGWFRHLYRSGFCGPKRGGGLRGSCSQRCKRGGVLPRLARNTVGGAAQRSGNVVSVDHLLWI